MTLTWLRSQRHIVLPLMGGLYAMVFMIVYPLIGTSVSTLLLVFILSTALLYEFRVVLIMWLLAFPFNSLLLTLAGTGGWDVFTQRGALIGMLITLVLSVAVSYVRSMNMKIQQALRERVQLAEQLRVANEQLEQRVQDRTNELQSLTAMLSHEFRTPLSGILIAASTLEAYGMRMSQEQQLQRYRNIQSQARFLNAMIDDMLIVTRSGHIETMFEKTDLIAVCKAVIERLAPLHQEAHTVVLDVPTPPLEADVDAQLFAQIMTNLLSNAIKYSPNGGDIGVMLNATGERVTLRVCDHGIGIPPDVLPNVFMPYSRANNVGAIKGTGLGLAVVKRAVDLHGGQVRVESVVGAGTTFTVELPRFHASAPFVVAAAVPVPQPQHA